MRDDPIFFLQVLPGRYRHGARSATPCLSPGQLQSHLHAPVWQCPSQLAGFAHPALLTARGTARGCPWDALIPPHQRLG